MYVVSNIKAVIKQHNRGLGGTIWIVCENELLVAY